MKERVSRLIVGAVVAVLLAGFLVPAILGYKEGLWGRFVYDYQTLITGIVASAAAFMTISEMRRSDRASLARHLEAMAFQNLPYARRVANLYNAVAPDLLAIAKEDVFSSSRPPLGKRPSLEEKDAYASWLGRMEYELDKAIGCLEDKEWEEAKEAIPETLWALLGKARSTARDLKEMFPDKSKETDMASPTDFLLATNPAFSACRTTDPYDTPGIFSFVYSPRTWKALSETIVEINADLEQLRAAYKFARI